MTPAEERLWYGLRGWKVGKFRRQHPLGRFVLDFYCAAGKLCVEVDGDVHDAQAERDAERTAVLNAAGIHVLRFRNEEVLGDTPRVLRRIEAELHRRQATR
jgi:very-short-patch-repair endonuclease